MPWLQKKKFDFYWTTTLTTLRSWWEKCSFFISLGRSLWKYLLIWSYIVHGITNLSKKFPNGILPGKSMWNLKNFLSQKFQWSLTWFTSPITVPICGLVERVCPDIFIICLNFIFLSNWMVNIGLNYFTLSAKTPHKPFKIKLTFLQQRSW